MKKIIFLVLFLLVISACKKNGSNLDQGISSSQNNGINLLTQKVSYNYADTTTHHSSVSKLILDGGFTCTITVNYVGSNNYSVTINDNVSYDALNATMIIYKDGTAIETDYDLVNWNNITITRQLAPGTYYFYFELYGAGIQYFFQTQTFPILAEPTAPAGMLCLFRYLDPSNGHHICTYDWQELGCAAKGFIFEKVLGYTYPSLGAAPGLKPIYRYYKSSDGSHFTTDLLGNYSGFVYEKILGYVGTTATDSLSRSLNKYYNGSIDDHFVCVAPDVPKGGTGYAPDVDFTFGYVK